MLPRRRLDSHNEVRPRKGRTAARPRAADGEDGLSDAALRFLVESARDINSSLEVERVFERLASRVGEIVEHDHFCVLLHDATHGRLVPRFSLCDGPLSRPEETVALGEGWVGRAAAERGTVRVSEPRSVLAVPLVFNGRLVGVLDVESGRPNVFSAAHEALLVAIAAHFAVAIENARSYERVAAGERRLEEELATARQVQLGLLPNEAPRVAGLEIGMAYATARELGGDFIDFLPYGGGRMALAVGDAAGKASPAALLGAMAVGMLRGYGFQHRCGPGEMLRYLNERLNLPRVGPRSLAMVFAVYDELDRSLTISNAGVPWPYIARNGRVDKIPAAGMPLGVLDGFEYDEIRTLLERGDVLALCTDGLSESIGRHGDMFGGARMRTVLERHARDPAQSIADRLLAACVQHAGGSHALSDDCAVVVLRATAT